jgi:small subunit ribosomal protein S10e
MVLVSKEEKRAIYTYLLKEGVIVVKKDAYLTKHQHIEGVHNLKVMMIVKSLKSRGYLNDVYSWRWSYFTVTNSGVAYLAKSLGVSADVVPATYKKKRAVTTAPKVEEDDEKAVAAATPEGTTA